MSLIPEQKSRKNIDRQLEQCGWILRDYSSMNIHAGQGVAVREFPLRNGFGDYLLYANRDCRECPRLLGPFLQYCSVE